MKKICLLWLVFLMLPYMAVRAQDAEKKGLMLWAGANGSANWLVKSGESSQAGWGIGYGAALEYRYSNQWSGRLGLDIHIGSYKLSEGKYQDRFERWTFEMPVMLKRRLWKGFSVEAGLQAGYVYNYSDWEPWDQYYYHELASTEHYVDASFSKALPKWHLAVPIGITYDVGRFSFGLHLIRGITPIVRKGRAVSGEIENNIFSGNAFLQSVSLGINYCFPLN